MRLSIVKKKTEIYYYILDSYRDKKDKSKVITKRIETIGTYSKLKKEHDDPEAYAKSVVEKRNEERKKEKMLYQENIDFNEKVKNVDDENSLSVSLLRNVGWKYLKAVYDEYEIDKFFADKKGRIKYNPNDLNMMFSICRILDPKSKKATMEDLYKYYDAPEIGKNAGYAFLQYFAPYKYDYQAYLYKHTSQITNIDESVLYYDCTNYFCECSQDEDLLDDEGNILQYGFRRYGVSKEHRPNPIIEMGLFINSEGIPLAYDIFPGNTSEQVTAIPLENQVASFLKKKDFIYCADSGLNSAKIRFFNSLNKRKYVVSQSLKKTKDDDKTFIFNDSNWKFADNDEPVSFVEFKNLAIKFANGDKLTSEEEDLLSRDLIYKVVPTTRVVKKGEFSDVNLKSDIEFTDDMFVTFSAKYYLYEKGIFEKQLVRASKLARNKKGENIFSNPTSPKRFIKTICVNKDGVVVNCDEVNVLDSSKINSEEQVLGLFGTCTNIQNISVSEVLSINKRRWQIEMNFRIMKSYFKTRPFFVSDPDSITTHFSTCFTALLIQNVFEKKLNETIAKEGMTERLFTTSEIIKMLNNLNYSNHNDLYYEAQYTNSKMLEILEKTFHLGLDKKRTKRTSLQ